MTDDEFTARLETLKAEVDEALRKSKDPHPEPYTRKKARIYSIMQLAGDLGFGLGLSSGYCAECARRSWSNTKWGA